MSDFIIAIAGGLVAGLISNYLADVLPRNRKLTLPVCLDCGKNRDISKFLTGRNCEYCFSDRRGRFIIVLGVCILLTFGVQIYPIENLPFGVSLILIVFFTTIVITDIEFKVILEQMSVVGGFIGLIIGWYLHGIKATILGGVSGFLLFLILYYLGRLFARKMSQHRDEQVEEEALGFGDVYLAGIIGLFTGFPFVLTSLLIAILFGGIISAGFILFSILNKKYQAFQAIPYGPFIIVGGIISLYLFPLVK
jgi:leader peptidase (prepilin peptidase)/N-methyltransferase